MGIVLQNKQGSCVLFFFTLPFPLHDYTVESLGVLSGREDHSAVLDNN